MENRVLLYMNTVAAASIDLGVVMALVRQQPSGSGLAVLAAAAVLLPVLLAATVVQHRRLATAIDPA
jgi:hypothetical protein